jgi:ABC-type sugar transport system permease subunit
VKWREIAQARHSYLLIAPSFALVAAFLYYPALSGIYHAFTRWQTVGVSIWVGLDNFVAMASDPFILHGIVNQLILSLADFAKALIPPFIVAELIYALPRERERYWMRTFFVLPMVAPMMVIILMWYFIYDANMGLLNQTLGALGLDSWRQAWLGDPDFALGSIIAIGFPLRRVFHIDIPMLVPQIRLVVVLALIAGIQDFGRILVMTGGGPGYATYVPALWMYEQTFQLAHFGYACAIGLMLFIVILSGSTLVLRLMKSDMDN